MRRPGSIGHFCRSTCSLSLSNLYRAVLGHGVFFHVVGKGRRRRRGRAIAQLTAPDTKVLFFLRRPPGRSTLRFSAITHAKDILISFPLSEAGVRLTLL